MLAIGVVSVVINLMMLAPALFMLQVFDRVLSSGSHETLLMLTLGTALALALLLVFDYLRGRLQSVAGLTIGESLSPRVTRHLIREFSSSVGRPGPDALRDVALVRNCFSAKGLLALFDAPWLFVFVGVIALFHPLLGMAAGGSALLMLLLAWLADRLSREDTETIRRQAARTSGFLESSLVNAEVVQAMGMGENLLHRWHEMSDRLAHDQVKSARKSIAMASLVRIVRQCIQVGMLALGAWLVLQGQASAGVMIASTILLSRALAPVEQVVGSWRVITEGRAALQRLEVLLGPDEPARRPMDLPAPTGMLTVSGLVFRGTGDRIILNQVALQLGAGDSLAVIGPSAAGKSTLARLLVGIWHPFQGSVRLDGVELKDWPRGSVGQFIGYLPQDVELFAGTIAENIARLGAVDAEAVVDAARRAHVHDMILSLPGGYDAAVGDLGVMLSPGQRQRIGLARALYGSPALVVLDEPNANLDGAGEIALAKTLQLLKAMRVSVVVITHRAPLVAHVDKLLVLDKGRVQQFGPANEVRALLGQRNGGDGAQVVVLRAS